MYMIWYNPRAIFVVRHERSEIVPKNCPPVPKKVSDAAKNLKDGTKKEQSEAGKILKEHQDKKH